jgi:hypothetical protein
MSIPQTRTIRDLDVPLDTLLADLHDKQAKAASEKPALLSQMHAFLDADSDTAYPTPGYPQPPRKEGAPS